MAVTSAAEARELLQLYAREAMGKLELLLPVAKSACADALGSLQKARSGILSAAKDQKVSLSAYAQQLVSEATPHVRTVVAALQRAGEIPEFASI